VTELLDGPWQVALVVAPPGYGKTSAVEAWARHTPLPVIWHDLSVAASPDRLLAGLGDRHAAGEPTVVVFDRADEVDDPSFWVDLEALVARAGDALRVVLIARSEAAVPVGSWRSRGALVVVGREALAVRPDDDLALASERLDGIFRGIAPVHREIARRIAVPESIDSDLAVVLAGPRAGDAAIVLARHGLLEWAGADPDRRRFDPAVRRLLLEELRTADPAEHVRLHLQAADHFARAGDLAAAYRVLVAAGRSDAEAPLALFPILDLARAGDHAGIDRALAALPPPSTIDEPRLAVVIAGTCLLAGRLTLAEPWIARLDAFGDDGDEVFQRRRRMTRAYLDILRVELDAAEAELEGFDTSTGHSAVERGSLASLRATIALARQRPDDARRFVARAAGEPDFGSLVATSDGLAAWCDVLDGDVATAMARLTAFLGDIEHRVDRPNQVLLSATVVGAWAAYLSGDVATAGRYATIALADSDRLRCDWNVVRAGSVAVVTVLRLGGPAAARSLLIETRLRRRGPASVLDADLDATEVSILRALGRLDEAGDVVERLGDTPLSRVLHASLELETFGELRTPERLDGRDEWPGVLRIVASTLAAADDPAALRAAVAEAGKLGLVMPLTGHGPTLDAALARLPLDRLHPRLAQLLSAPPAGVPVSALSPPIALTPRERTVLALLPSHLTYDQIAQHLSLSVNTVKSNLKSIYRKLSVASRSDAVDAARAARLV